MRWRGLAAGVVAFGIGCNGGGGDGPGDSDDTEVPEPCDGAGTRTVDCGLNGAGTQAQACVDGLWQDDGACADPDVCVNDATQDLSCGLNGAGTQKQACTDGQWVDDGTCADPDTCVVDQPIAGACDLVCPGGTPVPTGQLWVDVATGAGHSCALDVRGEVWCWGADGSGQLGDGLPKASQDTPVHVTGVSGVVQITAGNLHTCALTSDGVVYCWGWDGHGQVGNGAPTDDVVEPVEVTGLTDVLAVSAGGDATCALRANGKGYCWGTDQFGGLGNGTTLTADQQAPTEVQGLTAAVTVSAGAYHVCAVRAGDKVACWGYDSDGQLGNGAGLTDPQPAPSTMSDGLGFEALTAGAFHTCGLRDAGRVFCWGQNTVGQLGLDLSSGSQSGPVAIDGLDQVVALDAGSLHTCGVLRDGSVVCWGSDEHGQLGNGTAVTADPSAPSAVEGLVDVVRIAAGDTHACAITADGTLWCWGDDSSGQVGNGATTGDQAAPVKVAGQAEVADCGVVQVDAGWGASPAACAVLADGTARCWGHDDVSQLGDGGSADQPSPVDVATPRFLVQVSVGERHACARTAEHVLVCWGDPTYRGSSASPPLHEVFLTSASTLAVDVSAGPTHTCFVRSLGTVACFGEDDLGQLGNGATTGTKYEPSDVTGLTTAVDVEVGRGFSCALTGGGSVSCWGDDSAGQLGNGAGVTGADAPATVPGVVRAVGLAVGGGHACALVADGTVSCWGSDDLGQRGDGAGVLPAQSGATKVQGVSGAVAIAAGEATTCARLGDGSVVCWGTDAHGERGDGPGVTDDQAAPTAMIAGGSVHGMALGQGFGCLVRRSGRPACWGADDVGQLGNGATTGTVEAPVSIPWDR